MKLQLTEKELEAVEYHLGYDIESAISSGFFADKSFQLPKEKDSQNALRKIQRLLNENMVEN
jgi:hypothetical protein